MQQRKYLSYNMLLWKQIRMCLKGEAKLKITVSLFLKLKIISEKCLGHFSYKYLLNEKVYKYVFFYKSLSNLSNFRDSSSWPLAPFPLFSLGLHNQSYCVYTIQSNQIISLSCLSL